MTVDVDLYRPPLVAKADLCEGDVSLVNHLREGVPDDVVVSQLTAPDTTPATPERNVFWFDVQPNGIRRIGANSGPTHTEEQLLATAAMIADATTKVDVTWRGATDDIVHVETCGPALGTEADQFPQSPNSDQSLYEDAVVDMRRMSQAEAMHLERTQPSYTYAFQLNSHDADTAFEYRKLNSQSAGRVSWETYSAHYAGSPRVSRPTRSLISLHERLGLPEVDSDLDEPAVAYVDTNALDYELVTSSLS